MFKKLHFVLFFAFLLLNTITSQSLDSIIGNYQKARGQISINEIKTIVIKGKRFMNDNSITCDFIQFIKRPDKFRDDIILDRNQISIIYYKGKCGIINPLSQENGFKEFKDISIDRIQSMEKADIPGLLIEWRKKCQLVAFDGVVNQDGKKFYKLRIITNSSDKLEYFIDTEDYLLKQVVYFPDSPNKIRVKYSNFKKSNNIVYPYQILYYNNNSCFRKEIINEYIYNTPIPDLYFQIN